MANEINLTGAAPAAAVIPSVPVPAPAPAAAPAVTIPAAAPVERVKVPASAIFDDADRKFAPAPASKTGDTPLPEKKSVPMAPEVKLPPKAEPVVPEVTPAPTPAPVPAPVPVPAPEAKIKIGGKEYTNAELEQALAKSATPAPTPTPAPAPVVPAKVLTPEEISANEAAWTSQFIKENKLVVPFTKDETETLLTGGDESAALLSKKFTDTVAQAVLLARKSIYAEVGPVVDRLAGTVTPLVQQQIQLEKIAVEQQFVQEHPDIVPHVAVARSIAEELLRLYPNETRAMTREQFTREVYAQTDVYLQGEYRRFNPSASGSWRDANKPVAPIAPPAAGLATPAPAPAVVAAVIPRAPAPTANSPAGTASGGAPQSFSKSVAKSLQD